MGDVIGVARDHKNVIITSASTIASTTLEQIGRRVAGKLITPVTWVVVNRVDKSTPSALDMGLWLSGLLSTTAAAPAALITSFVKAATDDEIGRKLALVRAKEPAKSAPYIRACYNFGWASPSVNAMRIADKGGTAWTTSVGLWVYIADAKNRLIADYQPKEFVTMCRPKKPYRTKSTGGFDWEVIRR